MNALEFSEIILQLFVTINEHSDRTDLIRHKDGVIVLYLEYANVI